MDFSVTETENGVQQIEFIIPFSVHDGNSVRIDYAQAFPKALSEKINPEPIRLLQM